MAYWAGTPGAVYAESRAEAPCYRVLDTHRPTFVEHLALGQDTYGDAWETFEILRLAQTTHQLPNSEDDLTAVLDAEQELAKESASFDAAEVAGNADEVQAARVTRAAAWQESQRMLGRYANRVAADLPHVRVAADYSDAPYARRLHPPVAGQKLLGDLRRAGDTHPLLQAGFCGGRYQQLEVTIEAVNVAIGRQGHDVAYRHEGGGVPDYFWLDTRQRPDR